MCGWTELNAPLRQAIILSQNCDIFSVNETHLKPNCIISIPGYTWYGHNRQYTHHRAKKYFGGVGIFVKNQLLNAFNISVVDKLFDGILAVKLELKTNNCSILLMSCYLPPENSVWGYDAEGYFNHVLHIIYSQECNMTLLMGDFNSRVGNLKDYVNEIDQLLPRDIKDIHINSHGRVFIDFIIETKLCIVNGWVCSPANDFTCLTSRGASVVDYFLVSMEHIEFCSEFAVVSCNQIIQEADLFHLLGDKCKTPDHSVLTASFDLTPLFQDYMYERITEHPLNTTES